MTYSEPPVTHCDVDKAAAKAARKAAKRERKAALANGEVLEHEKTKKAKVDIDDCQDQTSTNCDKKILKQMRLEAQLSIQILDAMYKPNVLVTRFFCHHCL